MEVFNVVVTEKLQREVEIQADDEEEALWLLEQKYNDCDIILDYSDLVDTEFSNCVYTKNEIRIMDQITSFCQDECPSHCQCPEEECVLFRIEKIIENGFV